MPDKPKGDIIRLWTEAKVSQTNFNLKALSIAASVFSQISDAHPVVAENPESYLTPIPRTLKDFRESVDAVFKAAGLEKVEWDVPQV